MGQLHYDAVASFAFDDRSLAHLRAVIVAKLNLQESLVFTWLDAGQQRSIWIHPSIPLQFEFDAEQTPELNPAWIEQIMVLANSTTGLRWIEEPDSEG